jgi:hypothetical protein
MDFMLSFTSGTPIAAIHEGKYHGKILHIVEEKEEPSRSLEEEDIEELLEAEDFKPFSRGNKQLRPLDRQKLLKALRREQEPLDEALIELYRRGLQKVNHKLKKEISLDCGRMFILPAPAPERVFVAGKSGSGKSCIAALYMNEYRRMYPNNSIYLISRHDDEHAYSTIEHTPISLESLEEGEVPELEDLSNSLVVFDDCDNLQNKELSATLRALGDNLISNGRKYGIYTMWLNHQLMDYSKTRNLLMEANKVVFFASGDNYHVSEYLRRYAQLSKANIKKILDLRSRWTMLSTTIPQYVVHEHGAFVL